MAALREESHRGYPVETIEPRQLKLTVPVPEAEMDRARREVVAATPDSTRSPASAPARPRARAWPPSWATDAIEAEALELASRVAVQLAVQAQGIIPSAPIQIEKAGDEPLVLEALVPLQPEVELGDYQAMRVEMPEPDPIEDEVVRRDHRGLAAGDGLPGAGGGVPPRRATWCGSPGRHAR